MPYDPYATESGADTLLEPLETAQRQRAESSHLVDLRRQPRFDTRFPAEVVAADGAPVHVFITNISLSGMRLEGSRQMLTALFQETSPLTEHTPTRVRVAFSLPDESGQLVPAKVQCRSVYARCDRKDTYQVGLEIVSFEEGHPTFRTYLKQRAAVS